MSETKKSGYVVPTDEGIRQFWTLHPFMKNGIRLQFTVEVDEKLSHSTSVTVSVGALDALRELLNSRHMAETGS